MSYLVLARKWRPQTFSDVVGQRPVVRTLQNALKRNRVAHAMLFSGVRGVGKTTLARIMAKALSCTGTENIPCNNCDSCKEITKGSAMDLVEIDGASNRGIQEIRDLKENIRFFPVKNRYKIIIIDEVHMLTSEAFNALLKTLEEPPDHVFFMFATTEIHKVPVTILSRCQRYELTRVGFAELAAFFKKIAESEKVAVSDRAIELITREAEGSVRDGLSLLDQVFSFGGDEVSAEDVSEVLGLVDQRVFESLTRALLNGDLAQSLELLDNTYGAGIDIKRFTSDLLHYFRAVLVCKTCLRPNEILDLSDQEMKGLTEIAANYNAETLYQYFQLLLKGVEEMHYSPHPRMVLEMTCIRAVQAGQVVPVSSLIEKIDSLLANAGVSTAPTVPQGHSKSSLSPAGAPPAVEEKKTIDLAPENVPLVPVSSKLEPASEAKTHEADNPEPPPKPMSAATPDTVQPAPQRDIRRDWDAFVDYVKDRKQWMAHVLLLSSGRRLDAGELQIKFDAAADCIMLQERDNLKLLSQFAQDFLQRECTVRTVVRGANVNGEQAADTETPREERRALAKDPLVILASEVLEGQVVGIRTGPRSR